MFNAKLNREWLVCGIVLFFTTVAAGQEKRRNEFPDELKFIPPSVRQLYVLRPAAVLGSDDFSELKKSVGSDLQKLVNRLTNRYFKFGLAKLEEIDSFTTANWIESRGQNYHEIAVLRTKSDHSEGFDMATHAVKHEIPFKGRTIFQIKTPIDGRYEYACIMDDRTIVWSSRDESIQQAIESDGKRLAAEEWSRVWSNNKNDSARFFVRLENEIQLPTPFPLQLKGSQWVCGNVRLGQSTAVNAEVKFKTARMANQATSKLKSAMDQMDAALTRQIAEQPDQQTTIKIQHDLLRSTKLKQNGDSLIASSIVSVDFQSLKQPLNQYFVAEERTWSANNLRQNGLAMYNFESAFGHFPTPVFVHESGKEYSWRIAILPFIGRQDIYDRYDFSQDWDSPHNLEVTSDMPDFFRSDLDDADSTNTSFFMLSGPGGMFGTEQPIKFADITDGSSNTMMLIQAKRDVHWAKPEDITIDPDQPLPEFGGFHDGGFNVVRADGSVQFVSDQIPEDVLRLFFTHNDGNVTPNLDEILRQIQNERKED